MAYTPTAQDTTNYNAIQQAAKAAYAAGPMPTTISITATGPTDPSNLPPGYLTAPDGDLFCKLTLIESTRTLYLKSANPLEVNWANTILPQRVTIENMETDFPDLGPAKVQEIKERLSIARNQCSFGVLGAQTNFIPVDGFDPSDAAAICPGKGGINLSNLQTLLDNSRLHAVHQGGVPYSPVAPPK